MSEAVDPALVWLAAIGQRLDALAAPAPPADPVVSEPADPALVWLAAIGQRLNELAAPAAPVSDPALAELPAGLAALEKQISRAGREQLKANSLAEAQLAQLTAALDALRAADARRETEVAALREAQDAARARARLEVIESLLPALDGLDEALRAGQALLDRFAAPPPRPPRRSSLWDRLRPAPAPPPPPDAALRQAMAAWLVGLTFVRQRLLDVLAADGVQPMTATGAPFDSRYHVAQEVVPAGDALPPGTVATELRRGYLAGDRVLRYAEVAVAK